MELIAKRTGAHVPRRQVEELTVRAAQDFDAYYRDRLCEPEQTDDLLVLSFDGKGIAMRHEDLREATRKAAAAEPTLHTRLAKGEKRRPAQRDRAPVHRRRARVGQPRAPQHPARACFASGPQSTKGVRFAEQFTARGRPLDRLDLRVPSFEHLRLSAMIGATQAAVGRPDDRAVVIGSSLGGLTAAWTAARDPRVVALVLLAPAFQLVTRWERQLGEDWERWRTTGWREVRDHTTGGLARIDFGFIEDAQGIDIGLPGLTVPTLILHGTGDDAVPITTSRQLAADNPHVRLIELDDGHELIASLPRLLTETEAFLAALPG